MKRYLVYIGKSLQGGISAIDYQTALQKARQKAFRPDRKSIRIRLANKPNTLLWALANQKEFGH